MKTTEHEPLRGILIDPEARTITEVDVYADSDGSTLKSMYELLKCRLVDIVRYAVYDALPGNPEDDIWVDDEGLYSECSDCFVLPGGLPIVGRGLILGQHDGDCRSHTLTPEAIEELKQVIRFRKRSADEVAMSTVILF